MDEIEIRKQAIIMYLANHNPTEICETLNKSRPWFYKWIKRYEANPKGDWFVEHSRRPHVIHRLIDKDLENLIIQIRLHLERTPYAQIGAISIQWELRKLRIEPPPVWTIDRIIKKHNLIHKKPKISKRNNEYPDYSLYFTHQLDLVGPRYLQKNTSKYYFSNIIDTNTRCVNINPIQNKSSEGATNTVIRFWKHFGIPDYLQMDNELSFRGSNRHPHSFGKLIRLALSKGVIPVFIPHSEPWRNGIIEKFNDTFDKKFFRTQNFTSIEHLVESALDFESFHNTNYRYSVLNNQTPLDVHKKNGKCYYLNSEYQIPDYIPLVDGDIIVIRFIRSDRKLNIFGETFLLKPELVYNYVEANISITAQALKVYCDDQLIQQFPYYIPVDWM
jgi:transposase InsO family protein